ncbi:hypothetical protein SGFS_095010 [Streptomyces graminofaciens]|uniref:DNA/RNA non-specific endonuclease n=1 Tax=Streptomyces graminofaciens TaxID=68212 RepID=A0ABM7FJB0_9ACTN|nr:DNA/RNA non-specific endonuclease [Streptomyces graminofaciens]BBC38207.1 hypothetical protein SGFS_095010 [Streptomyces graminofaciens]
MAVTKRASDELVGELKQFIRTRGSGYLQDPNVSSIGIGYKEKDGKRGTELALQFTVDRKVRPEGLESLRTVEIPETIDIGDGVRVPTDVVQRSYRPYFLVVDEEEGGEGEPGDAHGEVLRPFVKAAIDYGPPGGVREIECLELAATDAEASAAVTGYDPDFLAETVGVPRLDPSIEEDAVRLDGSEVIPYTHFSLALSTSRRFARWVAWNIDGGTIKKPARKGIGFIKDPRLPATAQVGNELYKDVGNKTNRLDRGHVARRADLLWGPLDEAKRANKDSFFYTNITPQMDDFNQSARHGLWGRLEDAVYEDVEVDDLRVSVFGGPVFNEDDRVFRGVGIPREFWKVLVFTEGGTLKCKAFLLTQSLVLPEALDLDEFRVFQVTLGELQERTHLGFPTEMNEADTMSARGALEALEARTPLELQSDIDWS